MPLTPDRIPACDHTNPAELEAWFGNFGYADHFRKVVLANCAEILRARAADEETKVSETRINDMAHTHVLYLDFLLQCLKGRTLREQNLRDSVVGQVGYVR